jgi:predicted nucleic acid-binding Zn ribbon protein
LALLSIIKPHYGVVALAFILAGRVKVGSMALALGLILNLVPFFVFWPREFPNNFIIWSNTLLSYQEYGSVTGLWPQNISFSQSIYLWVYSLDVASGGLLQQTLDFIEERQGLWGPLILVSMLALIFTFRKKLSVTQTSIIVVSAVSMTSAISYYYYIVVAIPFILSLHNESKSNSDSVGEFLQKNNQETRNRKIHFALWFASILTLVQFPILVIAQEGEQMITTSVLIGGAWITCYAYIFAVLWRSRDKPMISREK